MPYTIENTGEVMTLSGASSTSGVTIIPARWVNPADLATLLRRTTSNW